jgi:hypothetical protein
VGKFEASPNVDTAEKFFTSVAVRDKKCAPGKVGYGIMEGHVKGLGPLVVHGIKKLLRKIPSVLPAIGTIYKVGKIKGNS